MNLPTTGQILHQWDEWSLKVLYPFSDMPEDFHENDYSIVIGLFRNQNLQFLWSGDLEKEGESLLLSQGVLHGSTKIWKAGHHGSNTSGSQPFLDTIAPELIIISCGVGNSYHHPSHGLYVVENDTIPIVRTDLEGSVYLRFKKDGAISWKSSRRGGLLPATP